MKTTRTLTRIEIASLRTLAADQEALRLRAVNDRRAATTDEAWLAADAEVIRMERAYRRTLDMIDAGAV